MKAVKMWTCANQISLLIVLFSTKYCRSVDLTLERGSIGTQVVETCATKIRESEIFPEDFNYLRNLAYVETRDGTELDSGDIGGIWKVTTVNFDAIKDETYNVSSYYPGIFSSFGIEWKTVSYTDLTTPLYSALGQRLYMEYVGREESWAEPSTILRQGLYWALNLTETEGTVSVYREAVSDILTGCGDPLRDVVFLIDSSLGNEDSYLTATKSVIETIVEELKIDTNTNKTGTGFAQFSNDYQVLLGLNTSTSEEYVNAAIGSVQKLDSNGRHIGLLSRRAMSDFLSTSASTKVLCVFIGGESDDSIESIAATALEKDVNVLAVGMTSDVSEAHLNDISTGDDMDTSFLLTNFSSHEALAFAITRQICAGTTVTQSPAVGQTVITGVVQPTKQSSLTIVVPAEGLESSVMTSTGTMDMYYSARIKRPSSAYYDYSLKVPSPNQAVALRYVPTTEELQQHGGLTVNLYITLQSTSDIPASFTITISGEDEPITIVVNITTNTSTANPVPSSNTGGGLSDGEIAGIVFSCLIVFCAILVAVVYFRFGKPGRRPFSMHRDKLDRPMDSRSRSRRSNTRTTPLEGPNAEGENGAQAKRLETNVRERLQSAIRRRDMPDLNDAVEDFMALKLDDYSGDFVKAQRMISVHQCKQGISRAINLRNIKILEKAIFRGKRMEYDIELKIELVNAEILLQDLKKTDNLLRRLKRAMETGDLAIAEAVTAELRVLKGCDQAMVDRMLFTFQLREDIEEAMLRRDINGINESIARIQEKGLERDLAAELKQARKMAKDLAIVEKARTEVMGLKQSRVSEIKSYSTPPPGVHEVMMSVYLLLGYHPTQLQSWTAIQALMGKTGREGLRRMIGELELTSVDVMHARMAKPLLDNFDMHHIRGISEALGVFYVFARSVIKEVEKFLPEVEQDNGSYSDLLDDTESSLGLTPYILR